MPDVCDHAQDHIEREDEARRQNARMKAQQRTLPATGRCWYCEADVGPQQLYCNAECAEDHHTEQRQKKALGR